MVNLRTFDLNLLRVFEAVINDRSVSKAADKLGMSQPAVSNALNRLRRQLNDPLFVRTLQGMEPTPKADQLSLAVNNGLTTIRAGLIAGMAFDPSTSQRQFTLLMTDVGEILFLPTLLSVLRRSAPHIDIKVMESGREGYSELLENGMADIALGRIQLADRFCSQHIHSSPFVILMSARNRLLEDREPDEHGNYKISYSEYLDARHILIQPNGATGDPIGNALGKDADERQIALTIPHSTVLPMIMGDTDLLATIPAAAAPNLMATGDLRIAAAPFKIEPNQVYLWWHRRNSADNGHRWLRELFANSGV